MSTRDLQKMVQALPQYSDQIDKLSLHVEVGCYILHDKLQNFKICTYLLLHQFSSKLGIMHLDIISQIFFKVILWSSYSKRV